MASDTQESPAELNFAQDGDILTHAEELVLALKQGDSERASALLDYISSARDSGLYNEVGKMARQLHDAMDNFCRETRIDELAEEEIPDARVRLRHVIDMTQKSADKSLTAAENTLPKCDALSARIDELGSSWQHFKKREMSVEQFRALSKQLETFFVEAEKDTSDIRNGLNDIMMAQDFQDLTGQIITRVIELVEEVEGNLVELVRLTGERMNQGDEKKVEKSAIDAEGPQVPGVAAGNAVNGQDEVDDLLSSLGF